MIFSGEFDHRIDSQGRVAIPVRFRDAFKPGMVLAEGYDRCIDVYTLDEWERVASDISDRPSTSANRRLARARFAGAFTADLDLTAMSLGVSRPADFGSRTYTLNAPAERPSPARWDCVRR